VLAGAVGAWLSRLLSGGRMRSNVRGFTLIEVMTVLTITGVLSAVALPSFDGQLRKTRRADALVAMAQIAGAQERLRSLGSRYGDLPELGVAAISPGGHYALQVTSFDADGYDVRALAIGAQTNDADCRYMAVHAAGMNLTHVSGTDATLANPDAVNRSCWSL
jgi:type IV pilus assembly protein PilE